ncbi:Non-motile and phage-resistance protein [Symmachiella dynata]|uniref:ATP-binding response regulator n=1 Tax=Symmachiella dynata TaxID=2527995 RepID=UPI00118D2B83|nr:hybrid sensor histidine kinase/response regulator [Symmachiella dynata]QDT47415.1 Non-motile and phage-resistance protein [Symmachiella dynata]
MEDHLGVLLIEDDATDYQLIKRSLKRCRRSTELVWEQSLNAGLRRLSEMSCDVVLTDLSLPDSFGLETVKRIRTQNQHVPILVLTTLDDEQVELSSLTVGAQDYLIKDEATPHTLERAIHHAIQRQESIVENQKLLARIESSHQLLTEQKSLLNKKNARLRKLYKTAHQFVDNVSHEFRTPLTVIKDYVSLVREGLAGEINEEQGRMLDIAGVRADDLNNMVDDMLDVSKLESGLIGAWRRPCNLAKIVTSVCPPLARKAAVKGIAFDVDVDEKLPAVYCDAEKVGRVIINLVTNAMKFCGDPGSVRIEAHQDAARSELMIDVTDNGPGIDDDGLALLFKRFQQLNTQPKGNAKGFGLGLSIAKELVDLNFGDISVESQLGQGTTFSFTVPLDDPLAVMTRYLQRRGANTTGESFFTLISAQIIDEDSNSAVSDVDAFFNYLLRRDDLLFRAGPQRWLFALPMRRSETVEFLKRVDDELQKTNRNRPFGPLPKFQMQVEGTWDVAFTPEVILDAFRQLIELQPACE